MGSEPRVLIIGAGIGGLALAQGFQKTGIPFTVFERDASPHFRPQGARFRLTATGIDALEACLTEDKIKTFRRLFPRATTHISKVNRFDVGTGFEHGAETFLELDDDSYAIDRALCKDFLTDGLDQHVQYSKNFHFYVALADRVTVVFEDGSTEHGTMVVGADGLRSHVARQLVGVRRLLDNDGRFITGRTTITRHLQSSIPHACREMCVFGETAASAPLILVTDPVCFNLAAKQYVSNRKSADDYIYWVLVSQSEVFDAVSSSSNFGRLTSQRAADLSRAVTSHWDPKITSILELQHDEVTQAFPIHFHTPEIPEWAAGQVTLLGDALHATAPAGGMGSNLALRGAVALLQAVNHHGINPAASAAYERRMRQVAPPIMKASILKSERTLKHRSLDQCTLVG